MATEETEAEGVPGEGSAGVPAGDTLTDNKTVTTGRPARRHWRESVIDHPGLDERGNIFFAAIEMTRMPMILADPNLEDCPIVFANKAFLDLTGYEESEILGRNCRFLQGPHTDRETVAQLRDAIARHESVAAEILNYRRDGSTFWNAVFIGPVFDTKGTLLYFFASQLDVTRRRNTEQSYRQAQKMEAIGQLTAGLAHDFNNLLQVVNGNLELLDGRIEDERSRRYIERASTAADRGAKLTRQLLAFARKSRLEARPVDLTRLVAGFGDMMESSLGSGIELHLSLRHGLPRAVLDPEQLEMALLNILINARDAMPGGGVVTVATGSLHLNGDAAARELAPGDYVFVEVRDQGEGMAPHVLERAAEPFFTTKGVGKGTGLGLAMATGYAQQSRGRLELESKEGQGTTVRLLFPASRVAEDEGPEAAPGAAGAQADPGADAAAHILIVEDTAAVLDLAAEILSAAGYRVSCATSAEEAMRLFDARRAAGEGFDLLFTDLVMPGGMNGLALADHCTRIDPELPVLMATGYNEELVAEGPRQPNADVLGKPYRRSELLDRVRQALRVQHRGGRRKASEFGSVEE
ncbi:histidine kinase famiy protein [Sphingomonas morindae]|uniref:histidine kinase n=1 Tax=Sphingomonas morindae TaxID=1541170 RepID=A0ABY4XBN3_9SPHN|nr:histidine kinase famiy protein [Sphingomonas morindae]USI74364.1 PAS domain-containing protein [Sphingomonas morindae]